MTSNRREFLVGGLSAGAAVPLVGSAIPKVHAGGVSAGRKMVYLQVRGGFDWLNVMVPADDPIYQAARPNLGIPKSKTLALQSGSSVYLAPAVASFKALFDRGEFAFLQNVGYPSPSLSHFESEKKYFAADPTTSVLTEGWIARYLRLAYTGSARIPVMDIENRLNGMLVGSSPPVLRNPAQFQFFSDSASPSGTDRRTELAMMKANAAVARGTAPFISEIGRGMAGAFDDSATILATGSSYRPRVTYPTSRLSTDLQVAARYITGGLDTEIYVVSTGGFDTHANEVVFGGWARTARSGPTMVMVPWRWSLVFRSMLVSTVSSPICPSPPRRTTTTTSRSTRVRRTSAASTRRCWAGGLVWRTQRSSSAARSRRCRSSDSEPKGREPNDATLLAVAPGWNR